MCLLKLSPNWQIALSQISLLVFSRPY